MTPGGREKRKTLPLRLRSLEALRDTAWPEERGRTASQTTQEHAAFIYVFLWLREVQTDRHSFTAKA